MTVLAYRKGVLAADTLATWRTHRDGSAKKILKIGQYLFGASGTYGLCVAWMDWVKAGMDPAKEPPMVRPSPATEGPMSASGYIFRPDGLIVALSLDGWTLIRADYWAGGSGCDYAYGAMAAGATAEEAVRAAIMFDTGCGGPIDVLTHGTAKPQQRVEDYRGGLKAPCPWMD